MLNWVKLILTLFSVSLLVLAAVRTTSETEGDAGFSEGTLPKVRFASSAYAAVIDHLLDRRRTGREEREKKAERLRGIRRREERFDGNGRHKEGICSLM